MNPKTGEIYGLAVAPTFNLNNPEEIIGISQKYKKTHDEKAPDYTSSVWTNYAITLAYDPGSTFKPIFASAAMNEAGLESCVVRVHGKTELNTPEYEEILKKDYPDVAIVVRDSMAVSLLNVARDLKIDIPNQMQIIGFQNTKYAELSRPSLTCINTPIYELGEIAMDLLTELMEDSLPEDKSINQLIDFNVVWRNTTK